MKLQIWFSWIISDILTLSRSGLCYSWIRNAISIIRLFEAPDTSYISKNHTISRNVYVYFIICLHW